MTFSAASSTKSSDTRSDHANTAPTPCVIKRYGPCYRPIKRPKHREIRYPGPATLEITAA
jgi:hypothetical protein